MNVRPQPIYRPSTVTPRSIGYSMQPGNTLVMQNPVPVVQTFGAAYSPTQPGAPIGNPGHVISGGYGISAPFTPVTVNAGNQLPTVLPIKVSNGGFQAPSQLQGVSRNPTLLSGPPPPTLPSFNAPVPTQNATGNMGAIPTAPTQAQFYSGGTQTNQTLGGNTVTPKSVVQNVSKGLFS